ncbi:MAG: radical SAM protein [Fibrobacter sp.]|nr:radical SAM protein [Fibrobacter sp.]
MNLVLCLTEQCNLRCTYCYYKDTQANRNAVMDDATLEQAIRIGVERTAFFKQQYLNITFFGGEPLLRRDAIYKGVEFAKAIVANAIDEGKVNKDFKLNFAVNTNGTLFDDEFFDFCEKEHFCIYLSLDGPEHHHDIARRTVNNGGSFKDIEKNIPRFTKLRAVALSTVTRLHIDTLFESVKWLHEQGFQSLTTSVDFDGKWTSEDFDRLALQYQKMALYWKECREKGDKVFIGTIHDKVKLVLINSRYKRYSCHVYNGAIGVATNGNIFPCTRFITSNEKAPYIQGNVFTGFDNEACEKIREFLDKDKKECDGCDIRYRCCAHECACTSFYTTGSIEGVSPEVCTHERMLAEICDTLVESLGTSF